MFPQRIWHYPVAPSPAISSTMYHPSPSIPLQPEIQEQSPPKTPALHLLLSDVTAPSSSHMGTGHVMNQALRSSEWDFVQQLPPSIPTHPSQIEVVLPQSGLFLEQPMPGPDYLSSLLPCANEPECTQANLSAGDLEPPLKRTAYVRFPAQDEFSQCELSQSAETQFDGSPARNVDASVETIIGSIPIEQAQIPSCAGLVPQNASTGWTSVPIRRTVIPSSPVNPSRCIPQQVTNSAPSAANSTMLCDTRPKLRFSKGASASKYCHICGRNSKTVAVAQCANVRIGLCRKVVCEKCLMLHRDEIGDRCSTPRADWKCTHCEGVCPKRARCHQYTKNNLRRRMKNDSKQRKKLQELRRRRAEMAVEERSKEMMQLTRKTSSYKA
ncbi:hypothetical protein FGB62_94g045 [Gracilaria domingensis]|nr:hypothetical protein FGB62_94g045 [Gracilaria domingensis]